jgi:hypothetical protein
MITCGCGGAIGGASPNGAHPGLLYKPLDAAIERVPALYYSGGPHGQQNCQKHTKL